MKLKAKLLCRTHSNTKIYWVPSMDQKDKQDIIFLHPGDLPSSGGSQKSQ
jgi:hypothetical protein